MADVEVDVSIVIGFRDWGIERLRRSVRSIQAAVGDLDVEVIVSDYGSGDPSLTETLAAEQGTRRVFTPRDPVWSRARALNAGLAEARGALLIATDADMIFAPGSLEAVHEEARATEPSALFLQCRDLPEDIPAALYDELDAESWEKLEGRSFLRPRWGMGGMVAADRECMALLNGFDERLHTYGREDLDFALRARRAGYRTAWTQDPRARMYHMWHPETTRHVSATSTGRDAIARNRRLVDGDATTTRNVTRRSAVLGDASPLVSIVVVPSPEGFSAYETVATALAQSVQAVEVIVLQPASSGGEALPEDSRLRVLPLDSAESEEGLRTAITQCRAPYVSVVRAGDLLPLHRTELLLSGAVAGTCGSTGTIAAATADGVLGVTPSDDHDHASLLRTTAGRALLDPANSDGRAGASVTRHARRAGLALAEVASTVTIRRSHGSAATAPAASDVATEQLRCLLPSSMSGGGRDAHLAQLHPDCTLPPLDGTAHFTHVRYGDETLRGDVVVRDASYDDLVALARAGTGLTVLSRAEHDGAADATWLEPIVQHAQRRGETGPLRVVRDAAPASGPSSYAVQHAAGAFGVTVTSERGSAFTEDTWLLIGARVEEVWP